MVWYVRVQSTESPRWRHSDSNCFSSSSVSRSHSSMKLRREMGCWISRRLGGLALAARLQRLEPGVVGQRRVAPHAVVVLDAALGREAVVVPAHGVEDVHAAHAAVARDQVGVRVAEDVAHVERARDRGWRGVDGEVLLARRGRVEAVDAGVLPRGVPAVVEPVDRCLLGDARHGGHSSRRARGVGATSAAGWTPTEKTKPRSAEGRTGVSPVATQLRGTLCVLSRRG